MIRILVQAALAVTLLACASAGAHDLSAGDANYVEQLRGSAPGTFAYLGAKHMFTGYDHLLFLTGVLFFLYRGRDILLYVTLFTLGHSVTLMAGVALNWQVNAHLIDAIIGLSIVYKAFENMGGFRRLLGRNPDTRIAVLVFGLCHGLGLATRIQAYAPRGEGLATNLISFNLGVELGQIAALGIILMMLLAWRRQPAFNGQAFAANTVLMCAGFTLTGYQLAGFVFA